MFNLRPDGVDMRQSAPSPGQIQVQQFRGMGGTQPRMTMPLRAAPTSYMNTPVQMGGAAQRFNMGPMPIEANPERLSGVRPGFGSQMNAVEQARMSPTPRPGFGAAKAALAGYMTGR